MKKEIIGLDLIRFLCASGVMISHILPKISSNYNWALVGGIGVDIFFCISGFIIPQSSEGRSPIEFAKSRIVRLAPGVWICASLSLLIFLFLRGTNAESGLLHKYIRSILFIPFGRSQSSGLSDIWIEAAYWTLFVEISFYSLIFIVLVFDRFQLMTKIATILGSISFLYWSSLLTLHHFAPAWKITEIIVKTDFKRYFDLTLVHHGAWFGLGLNIWLVNKLGIRNRCFSVLICLIGGLLQASHLPNIDFQGEQIARIVVATIGICLIVVSVIFNDRIGQIFEGTSKISRWIGLTTYPLYLLHARIGNSIIDTFSNSFPYNKIYTAVLTMMIMTVFSFFVAYSIEPRLQNWLKLKIDALITRFKSQIDLRLLRKTAPFPASNP